MSAPNQESSRWGLIIAGLALAGGVAWLDWSSRQANEQTIVEPVERAPRQDRSERDFVKTLSKKGMAAALNPVAAVPKAMLIATIEQPLFAPTRRQPPAPPPVVIAPPAPPPPPDPTELQLIGVMIANESSVALVRMRGQRKTHSLRAGEIISGWTIKEINARGLTVHKAEVEATIAVAANRAAPAGSQTQSGNKPWAGTPHRPVRPYTEPAQPASDGDVQSVKPPARKNGER